MESIIDAGVTRTGGARTDTVWALDGARPRLAAVGHNVHTMWLFEGRDQQIVQGKVAGAVPTRIDPPVDSTP